MVATTACAASVQAKDEMFPVPEAGNPIEGVSLVQSITCRPAERYGHQSRYPRKTSLARYRVHHRVGCTVTVKFFEEACTCNCPERVAWCHRDRCHHRRTTTVHRRERSHLPVPLYRPDRRRSLLQS